MRVSPNGSVSIISFFLFAGVMFSSVTVAGQTDIFPPLPGSDVSKFRPLSTPEKAGLVLKKDEVGDGYVLIAPRANTATYLIDSDGYVVHQWRHPKVAAASAYLLPDGHLLHTVRNSVGEIGDTVQELTWDGEVAWEYTTDKEVQRIHHDIEPLPNGNVLVTVWEKKSSREYVAAGRNPDTVPGGVMWVDVVYELQPTQDSVAKVVWRWSPWDHLIQNYDETKSNYGSPVEHPDRIDLNQVRENKKLSDWLHINSVSYNPERDEIILSIHSLDEIWIVSKKSGKLVYRWGNPRRYGKGGEEDRLLSGQHDAHWIADGLPGAGHILIFNNNAARGNERPHSAVLEVELPLRSGGAWPGLTDAGRYPAGKVVWEYTGAPDSMFHSSNFSGAQRLKNGGTLICVGVYGVIFEINAAGERVWEYVNPVSRKGPGLKRLEDWNTLPPSGGNGLFRSYKYTPDYPAFKEKDLSQQYLMGESTEGRQM